MKRTLFGILFVFFFFIAVYKITEEKIETISYESFEKKIQNKESFIVIIGRDDCPNCMDLKRMLKKTKKNIEYDIVYLRYTLENKEEFLTQVECYFDDIFEIPYYSLIKEGEILRSGQGYSSESEFWNFVEE